MSRPAKLLLPALAALAAAGIGCGTDKIDVKENSSARRGAELFAQRCSGCHTLAAAGTHGSAANIDTRERNDGPNFNIRCETLGRVLYAIRNGGYSGAIMPQNIVVGSQAQAVAAFVAKYSGQEAANPPSPQGGSDRQASRGSTPPKNAPAGGRCGTSLGAG